MACDQILVIKSLIIGIDIVRIEEIITFNLKQDLVSINAHIKYFNYSRMFVMVFFLNRNASKEVLIIGRSYKFALQIVNSTVQ